MNPDRLVQLREPVEQVVLTLGALEEDELVLGEPTVEPHVSWKHEDLPLPWKARLVLRPPDERASPARPLAQRQLQGVHPRHYELIEGPHVPLLLQPFRRHDCADIPRRHAELPGLVLLALSLHPDHHDAVGQGLELPVQQPLEATVGRLPHLLLAPRQLTGSLLDAVGPAREPHAHEHPPVPAPHLQHHDRHAAHHPPAARREERAPAGLHLRGQPLDGVLPQPAGEERASGRPQHVDGALAHNGRGVLRHGGDDLVRAKGQVEVVRPVAEGGRRLLQEVEEAAGVRPRQLPDQAPLG
mmetsp:Transcript_26093/g.74463  ORF Transcript_26093/g.74463 Transcript_26093/m.74463 type:complete len:299 (+) Transcript_26093:589-1485(+)